MDLYGNASVPIDMNMFTSPHHNHAHHQKPPPIEDENHTHIRLPFIGRIRCINDQNGRRSLFFVYLYWIYGTSSSLFIVLIPAYNDGNIAAFLIYFYLAISFLCLGSLIRASTLNPGRVNWTDNTTALEDESWTFCQICQRKRPWRAHHCRRCRQCVSRMDHHCPWINNCVGEANHYAFMLLLFYAFLLGLTSFLIAMLHFWVLPKCVTCDREVFYIKHSIWFMYLLTILGLNMALVMGVQFIGQHFNLLLDRTTLQSMQGQPEIGSIKIRGVYAAYKDTFGRNAVMCWFLPCRGRQTENISLTHPV